jgi:ubiquinone/menaquinone biosynthesis C-methylase UbiE
VRPCTDRNLQVDDLEGRMDLAVAIDVLHEMPEPAQALAAMARCLRPGGRLLIMEPKGHCSAALFQAEKAWALEADLRALPRPEGIPARRHAALFERS